MWSCDRFVDAVQHRVEKMRAPRETAHVLVHCSAGIGRTGVFIAIDATLRCVRRAIKNVQDFVSRLLFKMREHRPGMIQNRVLCLFSSSPLSPSSCSTFRTHPHKQWPEASLFPSSRSPAPRPRPSTGSCSRRLEPVSSS